MSGCSYQRHFDSGLLQRSRVGLGDGAIGDYFFQSGWRCDQGQAAASEFAGVANGDRTLGNFDHHPIYFGFQQVRSAEAELRVEAVDTEKKKVGAEAAQSFFGDGPDQRKRILTQRASGEDDLDGCAGEFGGDIYRIRDDGEVLEMTQGAGDGGGSGAGIENHDLALAHFRRRALCNPHFFLAVKFFFLAERGVFKRALAGGESSSVCAMHETVRVQEFEILANRNLRGFEMAAEIGDQDSALAVKQFENGAAAFFVEHGNRLGKV